MQQHKGFLADPPWAAVSAELFVGAFLPAPEWDWAGTASMGIGMLWLWDRPPAKAPREPVMLFGTHLFFLISLKKSVESSDSSRPSSQSPGMWFCFPFPGSTRCLGKVAGPQGRSCWPPPTATLRPFLLGGTP